MDVAPALQGDALKHDKQGPEDVIEVRDLVIGVHVHLATEEALWADVASTTDVWFPVFSFELSSSLIVNASLLEHTTEEIHSCNGKDDVEEDENYNGGLESRERCQHGLDKNPKSLDARHCTKGPEHSECSQT